MNKPLISIIVPIYKVEEYLNCCVQSILDQTYQNLEIILVDDGSPDNCPAICEAWAKKDSRIKVIHKKNAGLSAARNAGISISTGEWLMFVDADDAISKYLVDILYKECSGKNCLIVTKFLRFSDALPVVDNNSSIVQSIDFKSLIKARNGYYVWGALYSHSLIKQLELRFDETLKNLEDVVWNAVYLRYVESVKCIVTPMYYYRLNPTSITSQCVDRQWQVSSWLFAENSILNWFADKQLSAQQKVEVLKIHRQCQRNIYAECLAGNISYQQYHQLEQLVTEKTPCNEVLLHPFDRMLKNSMPWLYYRSYIFLLRMKRRIINRMGK